MSGWKDGSNKYFENFNIGTVQKSEAKTNLEI